MLNVIVLIDFSQWTRRKASHTPKNLSYLTSQLALQISMATWMPAIMRWSLEIGQGLMTLVSCLAANATQVNYVSTAIG